MLNVKFRIYFLMLASLFFYAWGEPRYILVMLLSIILNYIFGLLIHNTNTKWGRRLWLFLAIACNLGILFYFKYLNFTLVNVNRFFGTSFVYKTVMLPIGISFFTFQGISYIIDLYYRKVNIQRNPALVAFYISFFPQLIAGPIVRYSDIEGQIYKRTESLEKFANGAKRFVIGLAKKVIIANNVGFVADQIFSNSAIENTVATAWIGIICYAFQIFFDFSGYSDMAIGLGKLFGFDFLENFNYPYISKSITEFWRRWHMSLSTWFRDYVYIPLGGNRSGNVYLNLLIVFVLTGFWHGASFSFLVWGLWHGLFLVVERRFKLNKVNETRLNPLLHIVTLLIVIIGWVFFRAEGLKEALTYIGIMFGTVRPKNVGFTVWYYIDMKVVITLAIAVIASTPVFKLRFFKTIKTKPIYQCITGVAILAIFFISIVLVISSTYNPFIYFRF